MVIANGVNTLVRKDAVINLQLKAAQRYGIILCAKRSFNGM